ncbi:MAG: hypothetical protein LBE20_06350 [Deltaproteobacteria bacterium]|jgi:hypothetical protein|nr:hypothetical protein [Deltaproteobacteria bacterium]
MLSAYKFIQLICFTAYRRIIFFHYTKKNYQGLSLLTLVYLIIICLVTFGCTLQNTVTGLWSERSFKNSPYLIDDNDPKLQAKLLNPIPTKFVSFIIPPPTNPKTNKNNFFSFAVHNSDITSIAVRKDGKGAWTADSQGQIFYSEITDNLKLKSSLLLINNSSINLLAISPDEKFLAIAGPSTIALFNLKEKKVVAELSQISGRITALNWSVTGNYLVVGQVGSIVVWEIFKGATFVANETSNINSIETYKEGISPITDIYFYPNSRIYFATDQTGHLIARRLLKTENDMGLWGSSEKNMPQYINTKHVNLNTKTPIANLYFDELKDELITSHTNGLVIWWKIKGLIPVRLLHFEDKFVKKLEILSCPNKQNKISKHHYVTSSNDNIIRFWNINSFNTAEITPTIRNKIPAGIVFDKNLQTINRESALELQSPAFDDPVENIKSVWGSQYLWIIQKNGEITIFSCEPQSTSPDTHLKE